MPLWYGLGALAGLAGIGALIYFFGGGKFSGTRLDEIKSTEITWKLSGSTGGGRDHDGPMIDLLPDLNLKASGLNITPDPYQVGWPGQSRQSIKAVYKNNEGNKTVTGRVVEYDSNDVKRAEFIVVGGILDGAASAWDKNGHLIFRGNFEKGEPLGKVTYFLNDKNGQALMRRMIWWDKVLPTTVQLYHFNTIVMEVSISEGKVVKLYHWFNFKLSKQRQDDGEQERMMKQKIWKIEKTGWRYGKIQMGKQTAEGIPEPGRLGGMRDENGTMVYKNPQIVTEGDKDKGAVPDGADSSSSSITGEVILAHLKKKLLGDKKEPWAARLEKAMEDADTPSLVFNNGQIDSKKDDPSGGDGGGDSGGDSGDPGGGPGGPGGGPGGPGGGPGGPGGGVPGSP